MVLLSFTIDKGSLPVHEPRRDHDRYADNCRTRGDDCVSLENLAQDQPTEERCTEWRKCLEQQHERNIGMTERHDEADHHRAEQHASSSVLPGEPASDTA